MTRAFTKEERAQILALWRAGRDTLYISTTIPNCKEADIYNNLPHWRRLSDSHLITRRHKRAVPLEKARDYRNMIRKGFLAGEAAKMLGLA